MFCYQTVLLFYSLEHILVSSPNDNRNRHGYMIGLQYIDSAGSCAGDFAIKRKT